MSEDNSKRYLNLDGLDYFYGKLKQVFPLKSQVVTSVGLTGGTGISVSGSPITTSGSITVNHSNSVTAKSTSGLYPITFDAQGHITAAGTAVNAIEPYEIEWDQQIPQFPTYTQILNAINSNKFVYVKDSYHYDGNASDEASGFYGYYAYESQWETQDQDIINELVFVGKGQGGIWHFWSFNDASDQIQQQEQIDSYKHWTNEFANKSHGHGSLTSDGKLTIATDTTTNDAIVITDSSASNAIKKSSLTFIDRSNSNDGTFLSHNGHWLAPIDSLQFKDSSNNIIGTLSDNKVDVILQDASANHGGLVSTEMYQKIDALEDPKIKFIAAYTGGSPDVSKIPQGVSVVYNNTTYTGTLTPAAADAGTVYLVKKQDSPGPETAPYTGNIFYEYVAIFGMRWEMLGSVTSITAGAGLTGGTITDTGTIALATSGVTAGTYQGITVDSYGRVTSATDLGLVGLSYQVVQSLPAEGSAGVIYLVSNSGTGLNIYDEYIWMSGSPSGSYEKIGTTETDLSGYWQTSGTAANSLIAISTNEIDALFS